MAEQSVGRAAGAADNSRRPRRLGRGLRSLISVVPPGEAAPSAAPAASSAPQSEPTAASGPPAATLMELAITNIEPNPEQPRRTFDEQSLAGLADSLRANGMIQPVLVRPRPGGPASPGGARFQLIAGERRWRAAGRAGLAHVPAIIRTINEDAVLELALVENVQREDLNAIDRGRGYHALMQRIGLSQDALAQRLGESRANVANYLRLLELPDAVQEMVRDRRLGFGQARALLGLARPESRERLAREVAAADWPARRVEQFVAELLAEPSGEQGLERRLAAPAPTPGQVRMTPEPPPKPANIIELEQKLTERLGTRVAIRQGRRADMGKVVIDFYSLDDFDRILDALGVTSD